MVDFRVAYKPVLVLTPRTVSLSESETFVIGGIRYTVEPDAPSKVAGGKDGQWYFRRSKGFAGREFVLLTNDNRRIVTHNLWMGENTDEPDTASFEGAVAKPVSLAGTYGQPWARR